jgi:hypothetical protein
MLKNIYRDKRSLIKFPRKRIEKIKYIFLFPLLFMQYCTVPNPMAEGQENFYPLSLLIATLWVWFFSFLIVWWTYAVTMAYALHFSILPMVIYPFGIMLRDLKKLDDMKCVNAVFKQYASD